jgi:CRISPR-associated protein Cst2
LKVLNRDIKGRTENLNPLFVIGGVYTVKNPFFLNRIKVSYNKEKKAYSLNTEILSSITSVSFNNRLIRDDTILGYVKGFWLNEDEFNKICNTVFSDIGSFFDELKDRVNKYYHNEA